MTELKKTIDNRLSDPAPNGEPAVKADERRRLVQMKQEITSLIHSKNDEYSDIIARYSDEAALDNANKLGKLHTNAGPKKLTFSEIQSEYKSLTPIEQDAYKEGVLQQVSEIVRTTDKPDEWARKNLLGPSALKEKLTLVLGKDVVDEMASTAEQLTRRQDAAQGVKSAAEARGRATPPGGVGPALLNLIDEIAVSTSFASGHGATTRSMVPARRLMRGADTAMMKSIMDLAQAGGPEADAMISRIFGAAQRKATAAPNLMSGAALGASLMDE